MPCQLPDEITYVTDDVFSYMCNLAMEKCSRKAEKKKASCGGAAMRKRLLIKNFVAQMLAQDRQSKDTALSHSCSSTDNHTKEFSDDELFTSSTEFNTEEEVEMDDEAEDEQQEEDEEGCEHNTSTLEEDEMEDDEQQNDLEYNATEQLEDEAAAATILPSKSDTDVDENIRSMDDHHQYTAQSEKYQGHRTAVDEKIEIAIKESSGISPPSSTFGSMDCWKAVTLDDDFHKVPIPDSHCEEHIFDVDESTPNICMADEYGWRFYGLDISNEQHHPEKAHRDQFSPYSNDFPMDLLDEDKLYFLEKSDSNDHQLVGLVNMIPSGAMFGDDNDFYLNGQQLLTNLDAAERACGREGRLGRKRPWSLVLTTEEEASLLANHNIITTAATTTNAIDSTTLLSPLCCGILQMSPFGGGNAGIVSGGVGCNGGAAAASLHPMIKRVKL